MIPHHERGYSPAELRSRLEHTFKKYNENPTKRVSQNESPSTKPTDEPLIPSSIIAPRNLASFPPPQREVYITDDDWSTLHKAFPSASRIRYCFPFIVICGVEPPETPITVKGLIVEFYDTIKEFQYVPGEPGNPVVPDPLPRLPLPPHTHFDTFTALDTVRNSLSAALGFTVKSLATYLHLLVIGVDEVDYHPSALPGKVANRIALWSVEKRKWGHRLSQRAKDPLSPSRDNTDSVSVGLCPGIKVSSKSMSTSAGALLSNKTNGNQRLVVAAQGWGEDEDVVYHPDVGSPIGIIESVFRDKDVALVSLAPDLLFTNSTYLDAPPPKKLAKEAVVERSISVYSYFAANGFTTGACWMQLIGFESLNGARVGTFDTNHAYIFRRTRASAAETILLEASICGAPVVHQEDESEDISNIVVGFFSAFDGTNVVVPTVDYLIDAHWEIEQGDEAPVIRRNTEENLPRQMELD